MTKRTRGIWFDQAIDKYYSHDLKVLAKNQALLMKWAGMTYSTCKKVYLVHLSHSGVAKVQS